MTITTYEELEEHVRKNAGFVTMDMSALRDIHGAGKLGVHVVTNIHERLEALGLGHYPPELPQQQLEKVRIFKRTTPAGIMIHAAITLDDRSDQILRNVSSNEANDILEKIKEMVCG